MNTTEKTLWTSFAVVVVGIVGFLIFTGGSANAERNIALTSFASCIADSGAEFYAAFWCPYCQNQKAMFGAGQSELPYIECSTPDQRGQLQVCIDEGITTYPTWKFSDGSNLEGLLSLEQLGEKTGCEVPAL
ncbi:MAG: hypothetical protein WDZ88_03470 [Candidatus Paceibacterota bacterium]